MIGWPGMPGWPHMLGAGFAEFRCFKLSCLPIQITSQPAICRRSNWSLTAAGTRVAQLSAHKTWDIQVIVGLKSPFRILSNTWAA